MGRFKTLMLREWMQHQTGWLVMMGLPILLVIGAALFGQVHFDLDQVEGSPPPLLLVAVGTIAGVALLSLGITWGASLLQSPGLARRDVQDRSIEFWLSLPTSHVQSVGAPLLMHLLLVPWLALGIGMVGGLLTSLLVVSKIFGIGAWLTLPWGTVAAAAAMFAFRVMLGLALAVLWLSPLILGTMAASAWLKRWGVPLVAGVVVIGGNVLDRFYGNPIVWNVLQTLGEQASRAFLAAERGGAPLGMTTDNPDDVAKMIGWFPGWALQDAGQALMALASPAFAGALLAGAAGFGLLWLRRQRGA